MAPAGRHGPFCFLLAFVAGFNVMVLEMCAFRVLPTTFGSSVYVTGTLLSLIMIALSLGYYTGGYFSARFTTLGYLFASILVAAAYVHVTSVMLDHRILDFTFGLFRKQGSPLPAIALTVVILYFPPMLALSQVTPFLLNHLARFGGGLGVGPTAGKLMATSTIGSILGTLAPTFVLIPSLGVRRTTLVFEVTLVLAVIIGWSLFGRRGRGLATAALMALGLLSTRFASRPAPTPHQVIHESESLYGNIKLIVRADAKFGRQLVYVPSRTYEHSSVYPGAVMKSSGVAIDYLTFLTLAPGKRVLVLGTALGTAVAMAVEIDPTLQITGVEIDPEVIALSREHLSQLRSPNVRLVAEDARVFLQRDEGTYDYVLVDLFAGGFLPPHCVTREFFELVRARMADDGVMFINSNMPEYPALESLSSVERPAWHLESAIIGAGFPQLLRSDFAFNGHLTAFLGPRPLETHRERLRTQARRADLPLEYRAQLALESFSVSEVPRSRAEQAPFTDDWAPDNLIYLRDNLGGHLRAAAVAGEGEWQSLVRAREHSSAQQIAQWRFWEVAQRPDGSFLEFMRSAGQGRFCTEVNAWASASSEPITELFRYLNRFDARQCASTTSQLPSEPPQSRVSAIRGLLLAAALVQEGRVDEAWPQLALAIESPVLTVH